MGSKYEKISRGIRLLAVIAFIVLKLTGTVDWSWWWILVPVFLFMY